MDVTEIVIELNSLIKERFTDFKGTYLYGSFAKGTNQIDSDMDLVVLFDFVNRDKKLDVYDISIDIELKHGIVLDIHPMTSQELSNNQIYYNEVVNKGSFYVV